MYSHDDDRRTASHLFEREDAKLISLRRIYSEYSLGVERLKEIKLSLGVYNILYMKRTKEDDAIA